jgi:hypothetical protein
MKNLLAITLGTRDIQIRLSALHPNEWQQDKNIIYHKIIEALTFPCYPPPGFEDTLCFSQPRTAGALILNNYEILLPILHFPLLKPVVDFLKNKAIPLHHILLLCTDQQEEYNAGRVKPKDYQNDTLFFGEIVARFLQAYLSLAQEQVEIYLVTKEVTNMDYLYTHFADKASKFFSVDPDEIDKIYLLPQGGIDHINQAFTLKLIQQFGERVMQLQQAEAQEPKQLNFPRLFLNDLYRQRRLQHLHDFEFGLLAENINPGHKALAVVRRLAQWADAKLHLRFAALPDILKQVQPRLKGEPELFQWLQEESRDTPTMRLQALTVMCMIQCQQGNMSDLLWRLFTLAENLFKVKLENDHGWPDTSKFYIPGPTIEKNEDWEAFLGEELVQVLISKNIYITNPNRFAYQAIYLHLNMQHPQYSTYERIINAINTLAGMRNKLAHHLKPVDADDVNKVLSKFNFNVPGLLENIGEIIGLQKPNFAHKIQYFIKPTLNN